MQDNRTETAIVFSETALSLDLEGNASVEGNLTATLVDEELETIDQPLTFTVSPAEGLTYDETTGKVTATAEGTYTITATFAGSNDYQGSNETCTVTVTNSANVEAPEFSIETGTAVAEGTVVTITNENDDYVYFYTTDGSKPDCDSDLNATGTSAAYSDGIEINEAVTIKAIAANIFGFKSEVTTVSYTIKEAPSIDLRGKEETIEFTAAGFTFSGNGYNDYADATVSDTNNNSYEGWTLKQVMKGNSGVQMAKSKAGIITLPAVKSDNGFTVEVKATINSVNITDGTNTATAASGTNDGIGSLTVTATNANITIQTGDKYTVITSIKLIPTVPASVIIGDAGWATYVASDNVYFGDVTAYIVENTTETSVSLKEVLAVKAGTPVIVNGEADKYELEVVDEDDCDDTSKNLLKVVGKGDTVKKAYVLANVDDVVAFYLYEDSGLKAGRVYLPADGDNARQMLAIDGGEASGIESIENGKLRMENSVYNMQGQRVGQSSIFNSQSSILKKGLYIVNGKKMIIK